MKKKQVLACLLGGCLLLTLAACKQSANNTEEDDSPAYAEDVQTDTGSAAQEPQTAEEPKETESTKQDAQETADDTAEQSNEEQSEEKPTEDASDESNQDGEARNEISKTEAKESVVAAFGSEDPDNGNAYEYDFLSTEQIGSHQYYIYRMTWATDEQDGGAKSKTLNYIFVATDGSTIHTGTVDDDGYDIDYMS